jgi:hypothetical protein
VHVRKHDEVEAATTAGKLLDGGVNALEDKPPLGRK